MPHEPLTVMREKGEKLKERADLYSQTTARGVMQDCLKSVENL